MTEIQVYIGEAKQMRDDKCMSRIRNGFFAAWHNAKSSDSDAIDSNSCMWNFIEEFPPIPSSLRLMREIFK